MRRLLTILLIAIYSAVLGQDIKPISPNFKSLQSPSFSYYATDSTVWIYKGVTYGWTKLVSSKDLKDTLKYYPPYVGATKNVDLGSHSIIAEGQKLPINVGVVVMPNHIKNGDGTITLGSNGIFHFNKQTDGKSEIVHLAIGSSATITLTDGVVNYVYADYNNGSPFYANTLDNSIFKDDFTKIPVIRATREGNVVHFEEYDLYGVLLANKLMLKDIYINGGQRLSGLMLSTAPTRISTVSSGSAVFSVQYYANMQANIAGSAGSLYEYYLTSGVWNRSSVTSYDASYYSDGTNRQPLNNNKWVAKYMWRDVGDDNEVYYVHGNQYNSQSEAVNELVPMAPTVMTSHSIYVGKIVIQKGALNGIARPRIWEGAVQTTGASNHYDLSGSSLGWNASGHTGEANTLAAFDSGGLATNTTTGSLTENITGLEFSSTRQVIGGSTTLTVSTGYVIPTITNITHAESGYDNQITAIGVSGTTTKTITLTQQDTGTLSANFNVTKLDVGLGNVDNTSDINKPISTAVQTALNSKENTLTKGNITAGSTKIAIGGSGTNALIGNGASIDVNEGNLILSNIGGNVTDSQVPNTIALDNITQITNRSHTNLTDIGTNTHPQIDTFISSKGQNNGLATLDSGGKVPFSQLPASLMIYKGTWSALTNTPTLTNGIGTAGWVYKNNLAGTVNFGSGNISFYVGDWVIYNGTTWERSVGTDNVVSVNGQQGIVTLNTSHIPENTNLYFTDARARGAISLTTNGNSGASTYSSTTGLFNIPTYTLSGLGGEPALTKGNLTTDVTGLQFDNTRQVIGGAAKLSLASGYGIPTTTQISQIHPQGTDIQAPTLVGDNIGLTQTSTTISISGKEDKSNKVTSISGSSTDVQYPSAKLLYDQLLLKEPANANIQQHITNDQDLVVGNEYNTGVSFNPTTKELGVTDGGGTKTTTISITSGNIVNAYINTFTVTTTENSVTWPQAFANPNYKLDVDAYYYENQDGKSIRIKNAVYDYVKTVNGFSLKVDTVAGYIEYMAVDTTNLYPIQFNNYVPTSSITTVVGSPGSDTNIPSEKAVRTIVEANKMIYPSAGIAVSNGSTWSSSITDNHINWDAAYANRISALTTTGSSGAATLSSNTLNIPLYTLNGLGGQPLLSGSGIVKSTAGTISYITDNTSNWDVAYSDRLKWDGGSTGLVAATGRTSLGGTTIGQNIFTLTNPSAITFPRFNADNTVSSLSATDFKTALGITTTATSLDLTTSLSSNQSYLGITESGTVGENVVFGDVLYLKFSDGKWWKAKADAYSTTPATRMALASISANASGLLLIEGNIRYDSWTLAANKVYLSAATSGAITTTQPSTTGNQIQTLGVAKTSTTMYFKPSLDVGEK